MSTQKGNLQRNRAQKYQNRSAFKNNLHDTSNRTKIINSIQVSNVCQRCKEIIEWKIKYKKYKPLTQPKKCVKCEQKNVKQAYHVMCTECGKKYGSCTKCCQSKDVVVPKIEETEDVLDDELQNVLKSLPERKRRTFMRYLNKKKDEGKSKEDENEDLRAKLSALKVEEDDLSSGDDFISGESEDEI